MVLFSRQIEFIKDLENNIISLIDLSVEKTAEEIIQIITENQLIKKGVDGNLNPLRKYSNRHEKFRRKLGLQVEKTDLKITGDFHRSIFVDQFEDGFQILAEDEKTGELIEMYSVNILKPNISDLKELLKPEIIKNLKTYVNSQLTE